MRTILSPTAKTPKTKTSEYDGGEVEPRRIVHTTTRADLGSLTTQDFEP